MYLYSLVCLPKNHEKEAILLHRIRAIQDRLTPGVSMITAAHYSSYLEPLFLQLSENENSSCLVHVFTLTSESPFLQALLDSLFYTCSFFSFVLTPFYTESTQDNSRSHTWFAFVGIKDPNHPELRQMLQETRKEGVQAQIQPIFTDKAIISLHTTDSTVPSAIISRLESYLIQSPDFVLYSQAKF